jgi:Flp pilus assembly protein TadG
VNGIHRRHLDRGQAAVEVALALPIVVLLVLGVVQVVVVARSQISVELAARQAARAASVAAAPADAGRRAAEQATSLRPLDVTVTTNGELITVTVSYRDPTDAPLVGTVIGDVQVTASVTMRGEPPWVNTP